MTTVDERLSGRAARGLATTLAGQGAQFLLQMTSVVVLARLLDPQDYGLYAMVIFIVGIGEIVRDFGLSSAAIQAPVLSPGQRDNLFWVNTLIGATMMLALVAVAPVVATLFSQPDLTGVARALAVVFLLNGLATQFRADLNRRMCFGRLAAATLVAQAVSVAVGISAAVLGAGYWALVASQLAQALVLLVALVVLAGWLPHRPDRTQDIRAMLTFGRSFFATQVIQYAGSNLDTLTIGLRFGPAPLGIYNRGFQLLMTPLNQFRVPATTVALPVLSRLQDDTERAGRYLHRAQIAIGYTVVAALGVVAGAAVPIVDLFLGTRWHDVAPVLAWLCVAAACNMVGFVGYWAYLSRGLTAQLFRFTVVTLGLRVTGILVGSMWGIVGVAAGYAAAPAVAWPLSLWWIGRLTPLPVRELRRAALRGLLLATVAGAAAYVAVDLTSAGRPVVSVAAATLAGVAVYAVAALALPVVRSDLRSTVDLAKRVRR